MKVRYDMVACYVIRPGASGGDHEVLQLRRSPGEFMAGAGEQVRGKMEPGESAWGAALRELHEETGIRPDEFYQVNTIDIFYLHGDDTLWHCPGFCATVGRDAPIVMNEEHDAVRWVPRSRIETDFLWPGERSQLREVCREIMDDGPAKGYLRITL